MKPKNEQIFEEAKNIFKRIGLPIIEEDKSGTEWRFSTGIVSFDDDPEVRVAVFYETNSQYLIFSDRLAYPVSEKKVSSLNKMFSRINRHLVSSSIRIDDQTSTVELKSGFYVNGDHADEETFEKNLHSLLETEKRLFGPIHDFLDGTKGEQEVLSQVEEICKGGK